MYIKLKEEHYLNTTNLREITSQSGEELSGENTFKATREMFTDVYGYDSKHDVVFNEETNKFQYKTEEQKSQENI